MEPTTDPARAARAPLAHGAGFDVLGVRFRIESDEAPLVEPFAALLDGFRVDGVDSSAPALGLRVASGADAFAIDLDDGRFEVSGGIEGLLAHAYSVLLHWVFGRVRGHFLLHGAALARAGRGWVLAGRSGAGKTTLACALSGGDGWELFSDDVAAISRIDGRLHPFPKALSLRPGVASDDDLAAAVALPVLEGGAKRILRPEALGLRVGREPVPLGTIVFLEPEPAAPEPDSAPLVVVVHRHEPGLLAAVEALDGVESARERPGSGFVHIEVETRVAARCLSRIEDVCREAGVLVIGTARDVRRSAPDFDGRPELEPLRFDEALRRCLQSLWGTAQFRVVAELGGGAALYGRLAACLGGARCYRLKPGRYDETLAILTELARES